MSVFHFSPVSQETFDEALGSVPPAIQIALGFLVGEPISVRVCSVTGKYNMVFRAFMERDGACYQCAEPMTLAEFRALNAPAPGITAIYQEGRP
jgi:hypothetical protein